MSLETSPYTLLLWGLEDDVTSPPWTLLLTPITDTGHSRSYGYDGGLRRTSGYMDVEAGEPPKVNKWCLLPETFASAKVFDRVVEESTRSPPTNRTGETELANRPRLCWWIGYILCVAIMYWSEPTTAFWPVIKAWSGTVRESSHGGAIAARNAEAKEWNPSSCRHRNIESREDIHANNKRRTEDQLGQRFPIMFRLYAT